MNGLEERGRWLPRGQSSRSEQKGWDGDRGSSWGLVGPWTAASDGGHERMVSNVPPAGSKLSVIKRPATGDDGSPEANDCSESLADAALL